MRRITRSSLVTAVALGTLAIAVAAHAETPADKVLVCHGTASETNPYVLVSVSENALQGHLAGHGWQNGADDVFPFQTVPACRALYDDMYGGD